VAQLVQFARDPRRLRSRFQRDPPLLAAEMLLDGARLVAEASFFHHLAVPVDHGVATQLVPQVDSDRFHLQLFQSFVKLPHGWFLLCTSSSAFHSLPLSKASQPSHLICPVVMDSILPLLFGSKPDGCRLGVLWVALYFLW